MQYARGGVSPKEMSRARRTEILRRGVRPPVAALAGVRLALLPAREPQWPHAGAAADNHLVTWLLIRPHDGMARPAYGSGVGAWDAVGVDAPLSVEDVAALHQFSADL